MIAPLTHKYGDINIGIQSKCTCRARFLLQDSHLNIYCIIKSVGGENIDILSDNPEEPIYSLLIQRLLARLNLHHKNMYSYSFRPVDIGDIISANVDTYE
jgi:hypothetical protein